MLRFVRLFVLAATAAAVLGNVRSASALTTRHTGATDADYINLANTVLPQTGAVFGPGWIGSGTLISPTWVLTAGHVADPSATTFSSPAGTRNIIAKHTMGSPDIGLLQLDSPINSVAPIKLYDLFHGVEQGQAAMIAGAGNTGTGLTGQQGGTGGTPRAGHTNVYANAADWGWSSNDLLTWFRSPTGGAHAFEAGSANGDSGGGLFLNVGGEWSIAGVMSLAWFVGGSENIGKYDNGGVYPRTALFNDWILARATDAQVIPEPMSATALLFVATTLFGRFPRRRVA